MRLASSRGAGRRGGVCSTKKVNTSSRDMSDLPHSTAQDKTKQDKTSQTMRKVDELLLEEDCYDVHTFVVLCNSPCVYLNFPDRFPNPLSQDKARRVISVPTVLLLPFLSQTSSSKALLGMEESRNGVDRFTLLFLCIRLHCRDGLILKCWVASSTCAYC